MSEHVEEENTSEIATGVDYKDWNGVDIMQSMCMACGATGETRLMLHKIPYFRELIIASFYCEECGERNNEVTFGGEIQLQGCVYDLKVTCEKDLDRQIIKSDSASIRIPEIDFEIPAMTQRGGISTIEGMLKKAAENLAMHQEQRMEQMPEVGIRVAQVIGQLTMMANRFPSTFPFHIILHDPAGNSFVENPSAPHADPNLTVRYFTRTPEQDEALGLQPEKGVYRDDKESNFTALMTSDAGGFGQVKENRGEGAVTSRAAGDVSEADLDAGVVVIPTPCPHCQKEGESRSALTSIPHFKEVLIMAFNCKECGFRTNEVKGGGGVPTYGTEVVLRVCGPDDLSRDLLKSDTAMVAIPELELELQHGTMGGMFTTVEGLLQKIVQKLLESNPFAIGDSAVKHHAAEVEPNPFQPHSVSTGAGAGAGAAVPDVVNNKKQFEAFIERLKGLTKGESFPFTVVLRDPLGNSFISAPLGSSLPPEMDANLTMTDFERTFDENEELGLNDINTDHYGAEGEGEQKPAAVQGPILPDRLQRRHVKGPDHPTPFAKGTSDHDTTAGGMYFAPTTTATTASATASSTSTDQQAEGEFVQGPAGWRAARISVDLHLPQEPWNPAPAPDDGEGEDGEVESQPLQVLEGEGVYPTKRQFSQSDFQLKFLPREEFGGRMEGFVFRLGAQGLGYYEDTYKREAAAPVVTAEAQAQS